MDKILQRIQHLEDEKRRAESSLQSALQNARNLETSLAAERAAKAQSDAALTEALRAHRTTQALAESIKQELTQLKRDAAAKDQLVESLSSDKAQLQKTLEESQQKFAALTNEQGKAILANAAYYRARAKALNLPALAAELAEKSGMSDDSSAPVTDPQPSSARGSSKTTPEKAPISAVGAGSGSASVSSGSQAEREAEFEKELHTLRDGYVAAQLSLLRHKARATVLNEGMNVCSNMGGHCGPLLERVGASDAIVSLLEKAEEFVMVKRAELESVTSEGASAAGSSSSSSALIDLFAGAELLVDKGLTSVTEAVAQVAASVPRANAEAEGAEAGGGVNDSQMEGGASSDVDGTGAAGSQSEAGGVTSSSSSSSSGMDVEGEQQDDVSGATMSTPDGGSKARAVLLTPASDNSATGAGGESEERIYARLPLAPPSV